MIVVKIFFTVLIAAPILIGISNIFQNKNVPPADNINHWKALFNSAILYAIAYNVVFFIQELFLVLGKKALGLKAFLYHNNHNWEGEHPQTALMQGSGALAIFIFGIICCLLFQYFRKTNGIGKILLLWLAFHGLVQSLGQVMSVPFAPQTDIAQSLVDYLAFPKSLTIFLSVVSIISLILISYSVSRPLLETAPNSLQLSSPKAKMRYIRFVAVGAGILGTLLVIPFRVPPAYQVEGPIIIFLSFVPWIWAVSPRIKNVRSIQNKINKEIDWFSVGALIILLIVFRLVLAPGVEF